MITSIKGLKEADLIKKIADLSEGASNVTSNDDVTFENDENNIDTISLTTTTSSPETIVTHEDGSIEEITYRKTPEHRVKTNTIGELNVEHADLVSRSAKTARYATGEHSPYEGGEYPNGDCPILSKKITHPDGTIEEYTYWENGNVKSKKVYTVDKEGHVINQNTGQKSYINVLEYTTYWSNGNVQKDKDGYHDRNNSDITKKDNQVLYKGELIFGLQDPSGNFVGVPDEGGGYDFKTHSYYNTQVIGQLYEESLADYDPSSGNGLISSKSLCFCIEADECYLGNRKVSQDEALYMIEDRYNTEDLPGSYAVFVHTINGKKVYTVVTGDGQSDLNYFSFTEEEFQLFEKAYEEWENKPQDKWLLDDNGNRMLGIARFSHPLVSDSKNQEYFTPLSGQDYSYEVQKAHSRESNHSSDLDACFDYASRKDADGQGHCPGDFYYVDSLGIVSKRARFTDCPHAFQPENGAFNLVRNLINGNSSQYPKVEAGEELAHGRTAGSAPDRGEYYHFSSDSSTLDTSAPTSSPSTPSPTSNVSNLNLNSDEDENVDETDENGESGETPNATPQESEEYKAAKQQYDTLVKKLRETEAEKEKAQEEFQSELASQVAQAIANAQIEYISQTVEEGEEEIPYETFFDDEMAKITSKQFNSSVYDAKIQALNTQIEVAKSLMESYK